MEVAKKLGRPPKGASRMTPAQRVKRSRERAFEAMLTAAENLPSATTKALLGNLERQIKLIDEDVEYRQVGRDIAAQVISELCKRYEIELIRS